MKYIWFLLSFDKDISLIRTMLSNAMKVLASITLIFLVYNLQNEILEEVEDEKEIQKLISRVYHSPKDHFFSVLQNLKESNEFRKLAKELQNNLKFTIWLWNKKSDSFKSKYKVCAPWNFRQAETLLEMMSKRCHFSSSH